MLCLNTPSNFITFSTTDLITHPPTPQNKLNTIINNLQTRKKQLLQTLSKYQNPPSPHPYPSSTQQNPKISTSLTQKKKSYQLKIQTQQQSQTNLHLTIKQIQQQLFKSVVELQNYQLSLNKLSNSIGIIFRSALGISCIHNSISKKYLFHQILSLQSNIQQQSLKMKTILIQFYLVQNNFKQILQPPLTQSYSLLDFVINKKLVNKLYSFLIHYKQYRQQSIHCRTPTNTNNQIKYQVLSQSNSNHQQIQDISSSSSNTSSQSQQFQQNAHPKTQPIRSIPTNDHDTWLKILRIMKSLQTLQPLPITLQQQTVQSTKNDTINIKQLHQQIQNIISQSINIKKQCHILKLSIIHLNKTKQHLIKQFNNKSQLIESYHQKINKIYHQIDIEKQKISQIIISQNNNMQYFLSQANKKQLKQVQQALKYFHSKKLDKSKLSPQNHNQISNKKNTISDLSTLIISPTKSFLTQQKLLSPDYHNKKHLHSKKYSLKTLLSPNKFIGTSLDKRKAWK